MHQYAKAKTTRVFVIDVLLIVTWPGTRVTDSGMKPLYCSKTGFICLKPSPRNLIEYIVYRNNNTIFRAVRFQFLC